MAAADETSQLVSIESRLASIEAKLDALLASVVHETAAVAIPDVLKANLDHMDDDVLFQHMNNRRAAMATASATVPAPAPAPPMVAPAQPPYDGPIDTFVGLSEKERPTVINKYARMSEIECTRVQVDLFNRARRMIIMQCKGNGMTEEEIELSLDTPQIQEQICSCANDLEKQWLAE